MELVTCSQLTYYFEKQLHLLG